MDFNERLKNLDQEYDELVKNDTQAELNMDKETRDVLKKIKEKYQKMLDDVNQSVKENLNKQSSLCGNDKKLKRLGQQYVRFIKIIRQMELDMEREVNTTLSELKEKYQQIFNNIDRLADENLKNRAILCQNIVRFSKFRTENIAYTIRDLMRTIEGKSYDIYSQLMDDKNDNYGELVFIIESNSAQDYHTNGYLNTMIKQGKAIILSDNISIMEFYELKNNIEVISTVDFGKFVYVKEFIDYIISFKLEYNIDILSIRMLKNLKKQFISLKLKEIKKKKAQITSEKSDSDQKRMKLYLITNQ